MTLGEQLDLYDATADAAFEANLEWQRAHKADLIALGRVRLIAGFDVYGTSSWLKVPGQLEREKAEEFADGAVYEVIARHVRATMPRPRDEEDRGKPDD